MLSLSKHFCKNNSRAYNSNPDFDVNREWIPYASIEITSSSLTYLFYNVLFSKLENKKS